MSSICIAIGLPGQRGRSAPETDSKRAARKAAQRAAREERERLATERRLANRQRLLAADAAKATERAAIERAIWEREAALAVPAIQAVLRREMAAIGRLATAKAARAHREWLRLEVTRLQLQEALERQSRKREADIARLSRQGGRF